jgi:hypothetical protein
MSFVADNIQLLRRSAEDTKRDAKQWAALSGETDLTADGIESDMGESDDGVKIVYRSDDIVNATRLIDVLRNIIEINQITAGSKEISTMLQQLYRFQLAALCSVNELRATIVLERGVRTLGLPGGPCPGTKALRQELVRSIKLQQMSLSERGRG